MEISIFTGILLTILNSAFFVFSIYFVSDSRKEYIFSLFLLKKVMMIMIQKQFYIGFLLF